MKFDILEILDKDEFPEYCMAYLRQIKEEDIVASMSSSLVLLTTLCNSIPAEKYLYAYDQYKWTIQDVLQHIIDCERIFQYRALCIARNDNTSIPGFDENLYAKETTANSRNFEDLLAEYIVVRNSSIALFKSFNQIMLKRIGLANNLSISVRAIGYLISGHLLHHCNVVKQRYL